MSYYDQDRDTGLDYTHLRSRWVRAKKDHTCAVCKGMIPKNSMHSYTVYLSDGRFYAEHSHQGGGMCGFAEYESDPTQAYLDRGGHESDCE